MEGGVNLFDTNLGRMLAFKGGAGISLAGGEFSVSSDCKKTLLFTNIKIKNI